MNKQTKDKNKQTISTNKHEQSGGQMDKVSSLQPQDCGFEPHTGSQPWFLLWHQYCLVPGSGLKSDLNKLWELSSQSS